MGVRLKKVHGAWYLYVNHQGKRKCKKIGTDRKIAEEVRRKVEAKFALGDLVVFGVTDPCPQLRRSARSRPLAKGSTREYECKSSTSGGYEGVLRNYLRPRFATIPLHEIKRDQIKVMISEMIDSGLSRNTIKNTISVIRGMFNQAIEDGLLESNPAARLGRTTRAARQCDKKGVALTQPEIQCFLDAAQAICPDYYGLFLTALRAGLRRGELVSLQFGDLNFGEGEDDANRYIFVQHNYVLREHTTTKSKKPRRVDMSRELRRVLLALRDARLLAAYMKNESDITNELVFPSPDGGILDPDNLYHRLFIPALTKAGIRKIRLHDLRHTFGSLLIQQGASLTYVKEQLGHASIQTTVDIYGHLIPGPMSHSLIVLMGDKAEPESVNEPAATTCNKRKPRRKCRDSEGMTCLWKLLI